MKIRWFVIGLFALAALSMWAFPRGAPLPANQLTIADGDTIASWNFKGAYTGNPDLEKKAQDEIRRLSGLLGSGEYPEATLYVSIANDYDLLGDGKQEFEYLGRAIAVGETGLPWRNLGVLMERLGALNTALSAYEKSTLLQPQFKLYQYSYMEFLTTRMKDDAARIEAAYAAATANLGPDAEITQMYNDWKKL